jgi:CelD/BcsL family acetyltransferase involved in cellulose biosynthesis
MTVRTQVITDPSRVAALREPWQALWQRSPATIFQTYEWCSGWLAGVRARKDIRPMIGLAWEDDRLVGVMSCAVHRRTGVRMLQWAAQIFSDYCDCLIDSACDPTVVLAGLWEAIWQEGGFDVIRLQQVRPDAQCRAFVERGSGLRDAGRIDHCLRIDNRWSDGEHYFRSLNRKARNNHTRGKRILAELGGPVGLRVLEPGQPADATIDAILRLKEIWLRGADPNSPLLGIDRAAQRAVLDSAWQSGLCRIFLLTCGGRIASASINFVYAGRMEAYLTSYDAGYDRASPGTILIVEYARWAFDRGLSHVDFLRGEEAFKFRLANAETIITSFFGARTWLGHAAVSGHRWLSRRRPASAAPALEAAE